MPELPEVETIIRGLADKLKGRTIAHVEVFRRSILGKIEPEEFCRLLEGATFENIRRRGKFIVFQVGGGYLLAHLRMTGKFLFFPADDYPKLSHVRMSIHLENGGHLIYQDVRCLGTVCLYPPQTPLSPLEKLGPEPLSEEFTTKVLAEILSRTKREIKSVLMDQQKLAGIGNIYASEILFHSRIHPASQACRLSSAEITTLYNAVKDVLKRSISLHGTTFSDYRDIDNRQGRFQEFLNVYQKAGLPCRKCGQSIRKLVQGGRSTFFCPHCQKGA